MSTPLDISGLAFSIVNDTGYEGLQAKAFREISIVTQDEQGAARGVRLFLEFLEREAKGFNPTEPPKKAGKKKEESVGYAQRPESPQLPAPEFSTGNDPDLNP